jgi:hypothetical protein
VLAVVTAASLAWSVHATSGDATAAYFSTPARAWELGVGALMALGAQSGLVQRLPLRVAVALGWFGLSGIVASALLLTERTPFPGTAALLPVACTALVLQAGEAGAAGRNPVLVNPVSRYLGRISYSLYLWHWPVLVLSIAVLPAALVVVVPLAASLVLAALSHHLVEGPVRRSAWLSRRPVSAPTRAPLSWRPLDSGRRAAVALTATAALLVGGFLLPAVALNREGTPPSDAAASAPSAADDQEALAAEIAASVAPASWPELDPPLQGLRYAGAPEWITDKCENINPGNVATCRYGPPTAPRTAALFGDSIAISWLPALRDVLEPQGYLIQVLTRNQCAAPTVMFFRDRPGEPYTQCADHKQWAVQQVEALDPDLVLVSNSLTSVGQQIEEPPGDLRYERWRDGMTTTLSALGAPGRDVVLLGAPPRSGNLQACVTRFSAPSDCTEPVPLEWRAVSAAERAAAGAAGARYIDPEPWFCTGGRCPAVVGSTPVYTDGRHLTSAYSHRLAPQLAQALQVSTRS